MKPVSIWAASAQKEIQEAQPLELNFERGGIIAKLTSDSLWLIHTWTDGSKLAFRTAYSPSGKLEMISQNKSSQKTIFKLECNTLRFSVTVEVLKAEVESFSYQVEATPKMDLHLPFWPRDILPLTKSGSIKQQGTIHTHQVGTRSGILYFNDGTTGSVFYFQNLTALNHYCQDTESSAAELVGGSWPEIGYHLPKSRKPIKKDKTYTLSHAFVTLEENPPKNESEIAQQYLKRLADTYLTIPKPERCYHNWLETVENGLRDLWYHKGCWTFAGGHSYLNAYVADYRTPPEVMVQLAVLVPMLEYLDWKDERDHQLVSELLEGLPGFYKNDTGTIVRWLPAAESNLDHSEEQKKPSVMDSWYLHHPLMNLARLTERGEKTAAHLLFSSIDYVVKVAKHFEYDWPVFYQMDTLQVLKAETQPGQGGEKDVPGTYADLMLRMYELTKERKYLTEAKKASEKLKGLTFDIFYQANNTAFSAVAMLRLYKLTDDRQYLDLSYILLASIFTTCNFGVRLWARQKFPELLCGIPPEGRSLHRSLRRAGSLCGNAPVPKGVGRPGYPTSDTTAARRVHTPFGRKGRLLLSANAAQGNAGRQTQNR
jgi:hypothetical protein